jgi:hypothetical protein
LCLRVFPADKEASGKQPARPQSDRPHIGKQPESSGNDHLKYQSKAGMFGMSSIKHHVKAAYCQTALTMS